MACWLVGCLTTWLLTSPAIDLEAGKAMAKKQKTLSPIRPNVGIEVAYQKRLDALIAEMQRSLEHWLVAAYRAKPPAMATDATISYRGSASTVLQRVMARLATKWQKRFDDLAPMMAEHFTKAVADRSDKALASALRKQGVSVKLKTTPAVKDVVNASLNENVSLIKSIASEHLAAIEGLVQRSVAAGRDIGTLTKELEHRFGVTKRRAALIAQHQNNLATATMQKARYKELGITEAIWCHSHGGAQPRASHLKAGQDKLRFDPQVGAYIDGEHILPGEKINCRCFQKAVIEGF